MNKAQSLIDRVAKRTDRAILFHSASGKDSIALLDLIAPCFKEVVCVYLYIVKDLEHINRYISYATTKYSNVKFFQVPHFVLTSYIKTGYMGCRKNSAQKKETMATINEYMRNKTGIDWTFIGFKQSDSMNRRLMLRTYDDNGINEEQRKCYPLSDYKNKDVIDYIESRGLIRPEKYGVGQSAGTNITEMAYILWLRQNFPNDLKKVISTFPMVQRLLFEHDYAENQNK